MATPGASPLIDLQAAYASVCAAIRDALATPKASYSIDGVAKSWNEYYAMLSEQRKALEETPGVAPDTRPTFDVIL